MNGDQKSNGIFPIHLMRSGNSLTSQS
jgi:hypothetical protein